MNRRNLLKSATLVLFPAPAIVTPVLAEHVICYTLTDLFSTLKGCVLENPGCTVLSSDDPEHLRIGYCVEAVANHHLFEIHIRDLKKSFETFPKDQRAALREAFRSRAGRSILGEAFQRQGALT